MVEVVLMRIDNYPIIFQYISQESGKIRVIKDILSGERLKDRFFNNLLIILSAHKYHGHYLNAKDLSVNSYVRENNVINVR